jgi:hypothetical protein
MLSLASLYIFDVLSKSVSNAYLITTNKSFILSCQQEKLERRIAFSYSLQYDNSI